jgi:hypothetical protein
MHDVASRTAFTTSRLLEFCTIAELSKLVGSPPEYWAAVIVKELIDNGLDAAVRAGSRRRSPSRSRPRTALSR